MPKQDGGRKVTTSRGAATRRTRSRPAPAVRFEGTPLASALSHEEISARAYELFLARGGQHGDDWADWFRAEAEVLGKQGEGGRALGT
jgi:hypothetical protein